MIWAKPATPLPCMPVPKRCSRQPSHERAGDRLAAPVKIIWTEYLKYRAALRGFELGTLESIVRSSTERYHDADIGRTVVVGRHDSRLGIIPCDVDGEIVTPVTAHAITRHQLRFRLRTGWFRHG